MHFKNNIKHSDIDIIRIQGGEREKDKNSLEERMTENFPILVKERHTGPRSRVQYRVSQRRNMPRHISIT